jgi:WD40 repeat protein
MATVDTRDSDGDFRMEVYLKFWSWDEKNASWTLNTRIDKPHADKAITSLASSPEQFDDIPLQLVTAGEDGIVKVWRLRSRKLKSGEIEGSSYQCIHERRFHSCIILRVLGHPNYPQISFRKASIRLVVSGCFTTGCELRILRDHLRNNDLCCAQGPRIV